jgi:hypothetical protein
MFSRTKITPIVAARTARNTITGSVFPEPPTRFAVSARLIGWTTTRSVSGISAVACCCASHVLKELDARLARAIARALLGAVASIWRSGRSVGVEYCGAGTAVTVSCS